MSADYAVHGDVAVITLNNPPVNGLGLATRQAFMQGLDKAMADDAVKAVVVTGAGKAFSGGADIKEFGSPKAIQEPHLLTLISALENASKPVVAAIHTVAMGGGLELALGCHYRVAAPGTDVALPEVKLGLIPGAGGTQRLPRVLGVEPALNMIVSGEPIKSEMLAMLPGQKLFDQMATSAATLMDEAMAFARSVVGTSPLPRVRDMPCKHPNADAFFKFTTNMVNGMTKGKYPAPLKCIEAVQNATKMKFDEGMEAEREIFTNLMWTPECRALRHLFVAQRATTKIADVPADTPVREIKSVAVIGAGTMGGGISMNFLNAGIPVKILEMKQEALDKGIAIIEKNYQSQVKKGKLKEDKLAQRMGLLSTTLNYDDLKDADLVIEAVFEEMGVKETGVQETGRGDEAWCHLGVQHLHLGRQRHRRFHPTPARRGGLALFQPRQRDEAAGSGARRENRQRRDGHRHGCGQKNQENRRGLRRVRWLHWQPHDRAVQPPSRFPDRRRLHAPAGGQSGGEIWFRHGPVPHGRLGGQRHWLGDSQAPLRGKARPQIQQNR
jgi:3-hydroxyacyl-CoA dehydrogenase